MKILSIIGARPQFVKAAMVSRAIRKVNQENLLHTGQHYDNNLSQVFFDELGIPEPNIQLNIGSGTHSEQTGRMMIEIERYILSEKPDFVLVYGDTNSTIAGALAAAKLHIPVAHVEAGLRSYNQEMPEEINRVLTDHISKLLFCPTQTAGKNLRNEGIRNGIYIVGDVMGDALNYFGDVAKSKSDILEKINISPGNYRLATIHRPVNTDHSENLTQIIKVLNHSNLPVVFPIHPRTEKMMNTFSISLSQNVIPIKPVGYLDMLQLEKNAECILTDSGGIQKEAYWVGVRCITLREETEWVETVEMGWNKLVGANQNKILDALENWYPTTERPMIYGDGHASERIDSIISQYKG